MYRGNVEMPHDVERDAVRLIVLQGELCDGFGIATEGVLQAFRIAVVV